MVGWFIRVTSRRIELADLARVLALCASIGLTILPVPGQSSDGPSIPRTWEESALKEWATPLAGLNARPKHISESAYYALPVHELRTYPVYAPARGPAGYWEMVQRIGPQPFIEPSKLRLEADWITAGKRVFEEFDAELLWTGDPELLAIARDPQRFSELGGDVLADGTLNGLRWLPTKDGVLLTFPACSSCHTAYLQDGTPVLGAPPQGMRRYRGATVIAKVHYTNHVVTAHAPFVMGADFGARLYQAWGVPWRSGDIHQRVKTMTQEEFEPLRRGFLSSGGLPRWNGSIFFPAKIPDLIGIKDCKYIDHTATDLHRGIGDLMRYAALVSFAETADFGPHHVLEPATRRIGSGISDEALYALTLYIYSLKPPPNPHSFDEKARAGQRIFTREGCATCHTPPLYTNNKLTLARGFTPPQSLPASLDMLRVSVGTHTGLALETRKGTGYYKVPSLKGVWYRGRYLHEGAVASLEEMFNPDRLKETHVPGGWAPAGQKTYSIQGHEFGLQLAPVEREQLIAFLRTL